MPHRRACQLPQQVCGVSGGRAAHAVTRGYRRCHAHASAKGDRLPELACFFEGARPVVKKARKDLSARCEEKGFSL
eukprot:9837708-Alexandrium_andersonii.AAC.1